MKIEYTAYTLHDSRNSGFLYTGAMDDSAKGGGAKGGAKGGAGSGDTPNWMSRRS